MSKAATTELGMKQALWQPSAERMRNANMTRFIEYVNRKEEKRFSSYEELYAWSVENIPHFWAALAEFCEIKASRKFDIIIDDLDKMPGARWFTGAELNFAENLLRYRDDRTALIFKNETGATRKLSYAELYDAVARLATALKNAGVGRGDRVAGYLPNVPETVIAMLATTSLGAVWSSCSTDFGPRGVLDRFGQ